MSLSRTSFLCTRCGTRFDSLCSGGVFIHLVVWNLWGVEIEPLTDVYMKTTYLPGKVCKILEPTDSQWQHEEYFSKTLKLSLPSSIWTARLGIESNEVPENNFLATAEAVPTEVTGCMTASTHTDKPHLRVCNLSPPRNTYHMLTFECVCVCVCVAKYRCNIWKMLHTSDVRRMTRDVTAIQN